MRHSSSIRKGPRVHSATSRCLGPTLVLQSPVFFKTFTVHHLAVRGPRFSINSSLFGIHAFAVHQLAVWGPRSLFNRAMAESRRVRLCTAPWERAGGGPLMGAPTGRMIATPGPPPPKPLPSADGFVAMRPLRGAGKRGGGEGSRLSVLTPLQRTRMDDVSHAPFLACLARRPPPSTSDERYADIG